MSNMKKTHLIAIHAIGLTDQSAELVATGSYHPDGSAIMRRASQLIPPDAPFPVAALQGGIAEAEQLVAMEAARWPEGKAELNLINDLFGPEA